MTKKKEKAFIRKLETRYNAKHKNIADIMERSSEKYDGLDDVMALTERYFSIQSYKNAPRHHFINTYTGLIDEELKHKLPKKYVQDSFNNYKTILRSLRVSDPKLYPWVTKDYHRLCRMVVNYK